MRQDPVDHRRVVDRREDGHPAPTARTGENIGFKRPPHEVGPGAILGTGTVMGRLRRHALCVDRCGAWLDRARVGLGTPDDLAALRRVRRQDTMVKQQIYPRSRDLEVAGLGAPEEFALLH